jgi:hypothetical protein
VVPRLFEGCGVGPHDSTDRIGPKLLRTSWRVVSGLDVTLSQNTAMADHHDVLKPDGPLQGSMARQLFGDVEPAETADTMTWQLHCPKCGSDVMDRLGTGGDHTAVVLEPDRDEYVSPIGTRGGYVQVDLYCPAGHRFNLIIANHKGAEIVGIVPEGEMPLDDLF